MILTHGNLLNMLGILSGLHVANSRAELVFLRSETQHLLLEMVNKLDTFFLCFLFSISICMIVRDWVEMVVVKLGCRHQDYLN